MPSITKSKRVENTLRRRISKGTWKPGERLPSAEDLSDSLSVSYMTLRNVMTRLSQDGLIHRRPGRGTFVSEQPQAATIAVVSRASLMASPVSHVFVEMAEQACQLMANDGFRPVIKTGQGNTSEEFVESVDLFNGSAGGEIAGVLCLVELGELENRLTKLGIPAVSIVCGTPVDSHTVTLDYAALVEIGRDLLKSAGYDQFVLMCPEVAPGQANKPLAKEWQRLQMEMVDGDRDRLWSHRFTYDYRHAYTAFKEFWLSGRRPDAIFFWDDATFDVASRAILELGIDIPGELALVTQGNVGTHYHFPVPVTCVEFDTHQVVVAAWQMLDQMIAGRPIREPVVRIRPHIRPGQTLRNLIDKKQVKVNPADSVENNARNGCWI